MIKTALITIIALVGFSACSKDQQTISLSGKFNEMSPIMGRSQLEFIDGNLLIKSETGSIYRDTFFYKIENDKIKLTSTSPVNSNSDEFYFELLNNSKFKIQNLYPSIPEVPLTYMTYQK